MRPSATGTSQTGRLSGIYRLQRKLGRAEPKGESARLLADIVSRYYRRGDAKVAGGLSSPQLSLRHHAPVRPPAARGRDVRPNSFSTPRTQRGSLPAVEPLSCAILNFDSFAPPRNTVVSERVTASHVNCIGKVGYVVHICTGFPGLLTFPCCPRRKQTFSRRRYYIFFFSPSCERARARYSLFPGLIMN